MTYFTEDTVMWHHRPDSSNAARCSSGAIMPLQREYFHRVLSVDCDGFSLHSIPYFYGTFNVVTRRITNSPPFLISWSPRRETLPLAAGRTEFARARRLSSRFAAAQTSSRIWRRRRCAARSPLSACGRLNLRANLLSSSSVSFLRRCSVQHRFWDGKSRRLRGTQPKLRASTGAADV